MLMVETKACKFYDKSNELTRISIVFKQGIGQTQSTKR